MSRPHGPRADRSCNRCGLTRSYASPAFADRYWPNHLCDTLLAARERAAARAAHRTATAVVRPCRCKTVTHEHGDLGRYITDRCRCGPCRDAMAADCRDRKRQRVYGRWDYWRDAAPVRDHVRALMAAGMGWKRIGDVAGVPHSTVSNIIYGHPTARGRVASVRCRRTTAEKLLAVRCSLDDAGPTHQWPAVGTARRLQALVALGWSRQVLVDRLGWAFVTVQHIVDGATRTTTAAHAREVRGLYDQLSMTLPPTTNRHELKSATRSRNDARRRGWAPPLAWDDADLDDPAALPAGHVPDRDRGTDVDDAAVTRRLNGEHVPVNDATKAAIVDRWLASGRSLADCERVTGLNPWRVRREAA